MHPLAVALKLALAVVTEVAAPTGAPMPVATAPVTIPSLAGFVENRGQWPEEVRFFARGAAAEVTLLDDALVFRGAEGVLTLRLPRAASSLDGQVAVRQTRSYFRGATAVTGVKCFGTVVFRGVAPGVDLLVRPDGPSFAYDLLLAPGASLEDVTIQAEGALAVHLTSAVEMQILLAAGPITQAIGACWQVDPDTGARVPIDVHYRLDSANGAHAFGFVAPARNVARPLVIDPTLVYCTYLGSADPENPRDIAVDQEGNVYLLAQVSSMMPTTPGAFQSTAVALPTAWIGKLSGDGGELVWATFLDGSDIEVPVALTVDSLGVVATGHTWSLDFPTTAETVQPVHNPIPNRSDVFVARLDSANGHLTHGTFLGSDLSDVVTALTVAPNGDVVIAVRPSPLPPLSFEATPRAFDTVQDPPDKLIVRLSADLSEVVFATWFPISRIHALATDADGNVYFAGDSSTSTGPIPVTPGAFQTVPGDTKDGVVGKLDPTGSELLWCTYVGGSKADTIWGMALDQTRAVYVVGQTVPNVSDFPTTPGAFSNFPTPTGNGFVSKILADGSGLVWSTYIGGNGGGGGFLEECAVDAAGNVTVVGWQNQPGWPTTPDALMPNYVGGFPSSDLVVTKFDATGSTLVYSTFLGGSETDNPPYLAMDSLGRPHIAWLTISSDLPVTPGALQPNHFGGSEIGLAAFDLPVMPWRLIDSASKDAPYIPNLVGLGDLQPGSNTRLSVRGGKPFGLAWLVLGLAEWSLPLPLYGSVLYPSPDFLLPFQLGPSGELELNFPAPPGTGDLHFQLIGFEPTAPGMLYASNGLRTAKP
ncbi:MAG: hypothetical protein GC161_05155 [Planctomycetaceae bacterium]|nr:hypothetical protein [Planctomycetaceae bacterium]